MKSTVSYRHLFSYYKFRRNVARLFKNLLQKTLSNSADKERIMLNFIE